MRAGLLYAGTDDGRIWRTKDGGKIWTELKPKNVPVRWVSRIVASKYDLGTVYMTQTAGVTMISRFTYGNRLILVTHGQTYQAIYL
jgi:photosystem II stability/assembly factor-like uncharacterized protein